MANNGKALNILAIRFSAIGDVAMTVPVVDSFLRQYPQHHLTFLSNPRFEPFFQGMPSNFTFLGADVKREYHGNAGLSRLIKELSAHDFDLVLDLHGVLRSERIGLGLVLRGVRVRKIHKHRIARKALTRRHMKRRKPLESAFERYSNVFYAAGLPVNVDFTSIFHQAPQGVLALTGPKQGGRWVGVAPFAAHQGKVYPLHLMDRVVAGLQSDDSISRIFVFAYGKEKEQVAGWPEIYNKVEFTSGRFTFSQELELMYWLDVMLAMDSANMHLASLAGTRVVSVWGATHPVAGFLGYGQNESDCIQLDLTCRPCSIYGKKACLYGDCRCMTGISPAMILRKLEIRQK